MISPHFSLLSLSFFCQAEAAGMAVGAGTRRQRGDSSQALKNQPADLKCMITDKLRTI